jgi:hypothetical protein
MPWPTRVASVGKVNWTCVRVPLETDAVAQVTGDQDLRLPFQESERRKASGPSAKRCGPHGVRMVSSVLRFS